jgi:5-methylcytosine-specific restriction endonuclease McrA
MSDHSAAASLRTPPEALPSVPVPRAPGTMVDGAPFPDAIVEAVWERAQPIPGFDASLWRVDAANEAICRYDYGCVGVRFGWEIDHVRPVAQGGSDALANLQPLRIETNRRKGDAWPWYGR